MLTENVLDFYRAKLQYSTVDSAYPLGNSHLQIRGPESDHHGSVFGGSLRKGF